uniref:MYM-type domain-containing protein n=1 Tax=viral metagenome TaxID=1070528 RepID=A0A6C0H6W9_9ZZZZ
MSSIIQGKEVETGTVKKKKGRPRKTENQPMEKVSENKPVPENKAVLLESEPESQPQAEKKKRGRKKKEVVVEEIKQKKKRGRKAAVKYFSSSIRKKMPLTTVIQDNNNYILHLDIKDKEDNQTTDKMSVTYETLTSALSNSLQISKVENKSSGDKLIDSVFEQIQHDEVDNVKQGIREMLENDQNILADYIDKHDIELKPSDEFENNTLRELYERRIEFRENQDKQLVNKLEMLHHDETFLEKLLIDANNPKDDPSYETRCQKDKETSRKRGYFEILYPFLHNTKWLERTDVHCWWCCHPFDSVPVGLPVYFCDKSKKFRVKGVFCSFACMNSYKHDNGSRTSDYLVKYLYKKLTGESLCTNPLERAPPRCALKIFGGELDIEEFRNSTTEAKVYRMVEYPMYVSRDYVEEIDINNLKSANMKIFDDTTFNRVVSLDEKRVQDAKMRLSQIEKTTVTMGNTIDKFIKMI